MFGVFFVFVCKFEMMFALDEEFSPRMCMLSLSAVEEYACATVWTHCNAALHLSPILGD